MPLGFMLSRMCSYADGLFVVFVFDICASGILTGSLVHRDMSALPSVFTQDMNEIKETR